jgi:hypothetical protein
VLRLCHIVLRFRQSPRWLLIMSVLVLLRSTQSCSGNVTIVITRAGRCFTFGDGCSGQQAVPLDRCIPLIHSTELRPSFTFIFMMPFLKDRASLCLETPSCGCTPACAQGWWCGSIYCMRRRACRGSSCHFWRGWRRAQRSALLFMILRSRLLTARFCSQRQTC